MIEIAREGGIATITLRRPEARNALTPSDPTRRQLQMLGYTTEEEP